MKTSNKFKEAILEHLKFRAFTDPLFAVTLQKENKNIDDCVTYILNTVQKSGCNGFESDEIFGMAVHYYDEDDIDIGKGDNNMKVVVNHTVKLTSQEMADAKQKAIEEVIADEKARMVQKPGKAIDKPVKPNVGDSAISTLF